MKPRKPNKARKVRWYLQTREDCPQCGHSDNFREAMYTKPPKKEARYIYKQVWDYCDAL